MIHTEINNVRLLGNYLNAEKVLVENLISNEYLVHDTRTGVWPQVVRGNEIIIQKLYLRKKSRHGGTREVYKIISGSLHNTLKILNNQLGKVYSPPDCVHGFIKGRNIKTNAEQHLAKRNILSVDIKDFFPSITKLMVSSALESNGFIKEVANWISSIVTHEGCLVQGFNTSPTIANIVFEKLDKILLDRCGDQITYTRYADDLYFSSNADLPEHSIFENIINEYGFEINHNKTSLMKRGKKQYVTGLTVFDASSPRISKSIKKRIRLEVHYIHKEGLHKHAKNSIIRSGQTLPENKLEAALKIGSESEFIWRNLDGWLRFIHGIEPKFARKCWRKLDESNRRGPSIESGIISL
ncbi:MAG: reverse transcriptase family protein [Brumimicrobium sp.]